MTFNLYLGKRLSFDSQLCTIRYIGPLEGTKGDWLGVEWDDPARGKHDGERDGVRYFECLSKGSTAGSFVRPNRRVDEPKSFVDALRFKYASDEVHDPHVDVLFHTQAGDDAKIGVKQPLRISGKEVEEVGFDKIRKQLAQLGELKVIILDGLRIARPEARLVGGQPVWLEGSTDVKEACPRATELDLSRNLFEEWREVAAICEQLGQLKSLRVDGTRFRDTSLMPAEEDRCRHAFANISALRLDSTLLSWDETARLTQLFPALTTLITSLNLYGDISAAADLNPNITSISLEDNLLTSLSALHSLHSLPCLRRLVLKYNRISTIASISSDSAPAPFSPALTELDLSYNAIQSWSFIDGLPAIFPGLTSLRIAHNPLFASLVAPDGKPLTPEDGYMLTIARLEKLETLDYSPISAKERLNAESYYLSLIAKQLAFAEVQDEPDILKTHPRWKWLCEEYGEPAVRRAERDANPNSLAARLLRLHLYIAAAPAPGVDETQAQVRTPRRECVVLVPMGYSAYTLLGVVGRKFGIEPRKIRMVWETGEWVPKPTEKDGGVVDWDSEAEVEEEDDGKKEGDGLEAREVEIMPGTRSIGTWIDGKEATLRIEMKAEK